MKKIHINFRQHTHTHTHARDKKQQKQQYALHRNRLYNICPKTCHWRQIGGSRGVALPILNLSARFEWVVNATLPWRKCPGIHCTGGCVRPRTGMKNLTPRRGSNTEPNYCNRLRLIGELKTMYMKILGKKHFSWQGELSKKRWIAPTQWLCWNPYFHSCTFYNLMIYLKYYQWWT